MDFLVDQDQLLFWLNQYGSFALFALLAIGIVGLPIPEETMLILTGVLLNKGHIDPTATLFAAYMGSMCGISGSYFIGRTVGSQIIHKFGGWLGLTQVRLQYAHNWFEHYGKWSLSFGYFIPGIRHFTGIAAGVTELGYKEFALFAYCGAIVWVSLFLAVGYFLGDYWTPLYEIMDENLTLLIIAATGLVLAYLIVRSLRKKSRKRHPW